MTYSHKKIEEKWQKYWKENKVFKTNIQDYKRKKFYVLDMFPYPSGSGLHVGHLRGYLASDIVARIKMMQGYNVLHPMGFDSFGLPTEQYSIKTGRDPNVFTEKNIENFWKQLSLFGFTYDEKHIIKTHDPKYYKWTQWAFLKMFENGLAEEKMTTVNFCPELSTVLANEEIIQLNEQMVSERGQHPVIRKKEKQWVIKITKFADQLIEGLETLDWPSSIKSSQITWIGKTPLWLLFLNIYGTKTKLPIALNKIWEIKESDFVLIAINNKTIDCFLSNDIKKQLEKIRLEYSAKPLEIKTKLNKKPIGLKTNLFVINPINQKKMFIYFAEYIDENFATGIQFSDVENNIKDWFFASYHQILSKKKLETTKNENNKIEAINPSIEIIKNQLLNQKIKFQQTFFYHLRDWIFARQRYWGEPFPIIHHLNKITALKEKDLPLELPKINKDIFLKKYKMSPLSQMNEWVKKGYDTNTMPQWAGSCWYFLAYLLKDNNNGFYPLNSPESKKILNHWMPVDLYIGGQEHAVSHLLYSRFWNHFLVKMDCYNKKEPFQKLLNQGLILDQTGKKMSKSRGNVVNPNDFLISHGADAIRLWEKFLGPFQQKIRWRESGLDTMRKWLARVYRLFILKKVFLVNEKDQKVEIYYEAMLKKVIANYENFNFNVVVSELMKFINFCYKKKKINRIYGLSFLKLLHPICPHLTEEIWSLWGEKKLLINNKWPEISKTKIISKTYNLIVQINGQTKKILELDFDDKEKIIKRSKSILSDKLIKIKKVIYIKRKVINFVLD